MAIVIEPVVMINDKFWIDVVAEATARHMIGVARVLQGTPAAPHKGRHRERHP